MRRPKPTLSRCQATPQELLDTCLGFLRRKFYEGHEVSFAKDRRRLLQWVVLWPAKWLDERGVTLPPDQYRERFMKVFMEAMTFGQDVQNITYLPAYLAKVIQSHFRIHEDEIYEQAKSLRNVLDSVLATACRQVAPAPDPVRELATAARLLKAKKRASKPPVNAQLTLL